MLVDRPYLSIILRYVPEGTVWHPTDKTGPFSVLSRGCFRSVQAARKWAEQNIPGHTYETRVYW